jgi:hypothetical protein
MSYPSRHELDLERLEGELAMDPRSPAERLDAERLEVDHLRGEHGVEGEQVDLHENCGVCWRDYLAARRRS